MIAISEALVQIQNLIGADLHVGVWHANDGWIASTSGVRDGRTLIVNSDPAVNPSHAIRDLVPALITAGILAGSIDLPMIHDPTIHQVDTCTQVLMNAASRRAQLTYRSDTGVAKTATLFFWPRSADACRDGNTPRIEIPGRMAPGRFAVRVDQIRFHDERLEQSRTSFERLVLEAVRAQVDPLANRAG